MTRGRRASTWMAAVLVAAGILVASPAAASSHTTFIQLDVPPVTTVVQPAVPPIQLPVLDTRADQVLPSGPASVLPPVQQLLPSLAPLLTPAASPPAATTPVPSPPSAQSPLPFLPGASASAGVGPANPRPSPLTPPVATAVQGYEVQRPSTPNVDLTREAFRTAGRFWFPLAIAAALVAFVTVQWVVDHREPKLVASPLTDELLGFS
jgi:hypothetical protein